MQVQASTLSLDRPNIPLPAKEWVASGPQGLWAREKTPLTLHF